jgi:hypothetical protein
MSHRKTFIQVKFRFRQDLLRRLEREAKRHDRSTNDEITRCVEECLELRDRREQTDGFEKAVVAQLPLMQPQQLVGALIALAAAGGQWGRQLSMAAMRSQEGQALALEWHSMAYGKSEEELREAVHAKLTSARAAAAGDDSESSTTFSIKPAAERSGED